MPSKDTFVKKSKRCICALTLQDLEASIRDVEFISDCNLIDADSFMQLVLFSPSKQSNVGVKISKKLEKHIDALVHEIVSGLDVKNTYFYSSFTSKKEKEDLSRRVLEDNNTFLCLYCPDAFLESLYASIRNALAHGNIFKKGNHYYLYSVSSKEKSSTSDQERNITFLLKLYRLNKLSSYVAAFEKYN